MHKRIMDVGIVMAVARCFSMRIRGVYQFLEAIEQ
jgi:hypothetical protein